ncbi:MAG: hypothetical protein PHW47_11340 [Lachnospira sp.]|nr:hypothetical protein [Lachnospira sp.]
MEHKTKSEIEDTETLERNLKLTKLALVIVCISALLAVTAVYYGMQQNITQERKSVLGQIYSQNKEAGKLYAEAILINSVNSENEQAGVRAMDAMLYTRDAFDNVSIVYPLTLCMAGGTFCGLLVVIGIAVVYILCRKGAEQWIAEKKGNRQLCVRLDGMNEALQGKNRQIQTFIENVAHQIRTPVSLLYLNIEDIPDEDKRNNCMQSLERVKGLIQCLLRISRLEAGAVIMEKRDYDLADIMEGICNQYDSSELLFENSSSGKVMAHIDEEWFVESVSNIINNGQDIEVIPDLVSDFTFSVYSMYESEGLSYNESVKEWQKDFKNIRFSIKTIYQDETEKEQLYGMGFSSETSERPLLCELIKR